MNPNLTKLQSYPFEKLNLLKVGIKPPDVPPIGLYIGEPKHQTPAFVTETLCKNIGKLSVYPTTKGLHELREAIAQWAMRRFQLPQTLDAEHAILPVNGTREALFAFVQACIDTTKNPLVIIPNPFYQIYEGAALLAGAQLHYLNCTAAHGFIPDFDSVPEHIWERCQLLFICSPGNPTGAVMDITSMQRLITLADKFDFIIASDECYSELYFDEPPPGLLQACAAMGRNDFQRCVVFHSLSKRSNLPGLRSGFVAGDASILEKFLLYRTYHGCAMPLPTQLASISAWQDEVHVEENRMLYQKKFDAVLDIIGDTLDVTRPPASFYLWVATPGDDLAFTQKLYAQQNVTVLPGQFLSRTAQGINPGSNHVRMALVAPLDECIDAAHRIRQFVLSIR